MLLLLFNLLFTLLLGGFIFAYHRWSDVEDVARRLLQRYLTYKLGTRCTIQSLRLSFWGLELRNGLVANGPTARDGKPWAAPHSLRVARLRLEFGRLLNLCSVLLQPMRLGRLGMTFLFRVREIETMEVEGLDLHLEDRDDASGGSRRQWEH